MRLYASENRRTLFIFVALCGSGCGGGALGDGSDLATARDGAAGRDLSVVGVADLSTASPPDLSGLGCQGNETFVAARTAMLESCGGFGPMSCHTRGTFGGNLDLTTANAYRDLVNVQASGAPTKLRVKPGSPDESFLVQKLTNTQAVSEGNPMPQGEGIQWRAPDPAKLKTLRCWIARGAPND